MRRLRFRHRAVEARSRSGVSGTVLVSGVYRGATASRARIHAGPRILSGVESQQESFGQTQIPPRASGGRGSGVLWGVLGSPAIEVSFRVYVSCRRIQMLTSRRLYDVAPDRAIQCSKVVS